MTVGEKSDELIFRPRKKPVRRAKVPKFESVLFESLEPRMLLSGNLVISEVMAVNNTTLADSDGDFSDWFEIHNTTGSTINLDGWYATDDANDLAKFKFGDIDVAAGDFLVVFASSKDQAGSNAIVPHTNFNISGDGEYLALVQPDRTTVEFEYAPQMPSQASDISFGLAFEGATVQPDTQAFFVNPTPGAANDQGSTVEAAQFSHTSGTFSSNFQLTLSANSPTAQIFYTLDESLPTTSSTLYTGAITINGTTMVRTIVAEPGLAPGPVLSHTYVKLASDLLNFSSDLPVIVLDNFNSGSVPNNVKQHAFLSLFEQDAGTGRTSLTTDATITTSSGIKIRGSSTQNQPKKNYSVEFWDEQRDDRQFEVLGMPSDADWILHAPYHFDRALIRNPFIYEISNQTGNYAVRTRFVEVFVNTDGGNLSYADNYVGVYVLMEKIEAGEDRVDVGNLSPNDLTEPDITGGYVVKIDRLDPGDSGFVGGGITMGFVDPNEEDLAQEQKDWIKQHFDEFDAALDGPNFTDPELGYAKYLEVDTWIDHHILNVLSKNADALRLSTYISKVRGGKIEATPIWDFDRAMESYDSRDNSPTGWDGGTNYFEFGWWDRLFQDPNFWQRWIDRWQELRQTVLSTENMHNVIDGMSSELTEAAVRNFDRWTSVPPRGGTLQGEIDHLKQWLSDRADWIDEQFAGQPIFNQDGGLVTPGFEVEITSPVGEVVYTLDGTDPRLPGGGVSSSAFVAGSNRFDQTLIASGASWRYLDDGSNQGVAWRQVGFDDSSWSTGDAQLGYGGNGEDTTISFGPNANDKHITTYFRHTIDVQNIDEITTLTMGIVRDDGAVIYLNGVELERPNMPTGTIGFDTRASNAIGGADETRFFDFNIDPNLLAEGSNEIAIEVHQANPTSSDLSFDFRLIAERTIPSDPILINGNTKIIARTLDGSDWSGANQQTFVVNTPQLRITELNYNPYNPDAGSPFEDSDFEFVEIQNVGGAAADIVSTAIGGGITFTFPSLVLNPGEFAVLVKNTAAFESRYGTGHNIAGEYSGKLNDGGEVLTLSDALGAVITTFEYDNNNGWPQRADADGSSIEVIDPFGDYNDKDNWRASAEYGGSPGIAGEGHRGDIVINEVLSHTDLPQTDSIELYNTTGNVIDISGWFISDSTNYRKFQVPGNTFIEAGGYLVFDENDFNTSAGVDPLDFALDSAHGDEIYLLETDAADNPVRFVDQVAFGASLNGESFGRVPNATGELYPNLTVTLGQANSGPRIGPVVITEVMYNPLDPGNLPVGMTVDELEFIEIYNPTAQAIDLTDWRIRKGIDFDFAAGTIVGTGETLVIVAFDPLLNPEFRAAFEAAYPTAVNATLLGPFANKLDNGGERIQLQRPDGPPAEEPTFIPRLIEDEVRYDDMAPWPISSDGTGDSLLRRGDDLWGNSPISWRAGTPNPGTIDNTPPTIMAAMPNGGNAQRSLITEIAYQFDEAVNVGAALTLENLTTEQTIDPSAFQMDYDADTHIATWTFPGLATGTLPEGWYRATLHGTEITDMNGNMIDGDGDGDSGGDHIFTLYRYFGDRDGDRDVDPTDLFNFRLTYQLEDDDPGYDYIFDNDFDGDVDGSDLFRFRFNYLTTTAPPDLAGDDFASAFDLGLLASTTVVSAFVGGNDLADVYQFNVEQNSTLAFSLTGLTANANLKLYDSGFNLLDSSQEAGTTSELITRLLGQGTYYLVVDTAVTDVTHYQLGLVPE